MTNDFIELKPLTPQPDPHTWECSVFNPVYTEGVSVFIRKSSILHFVSFPNARRHDGWHASVVYFNGFKVNEKIFVYDTAREIMEKLK